MPTQFSEDTQNSREPLSSGYENTYTGNTSSEPVFFNAATGNSKLFVPDAATTSQVFSRPPIASNGSSIASGPVFSARPTQSATSLPIGVTSAPSMLLATQLFSYPTHQASGLPNCLEATGHYMQQQQQHHHFSGSHLIPSNNMEAASSSSLGSLSTAPNLPGPGVLIPRQKTHLRKAAGQVWSDATLDEWDNDDFRVFCGDLGNEVTDELLTNAFRHFKSFQKARVIRDKRTGKGRGYGFASFSDPQDMLRALQDMDKKYVGNRPIRVMKSKWKEREVGSTNNKRFNDIVSMTPTGSKTLKKFKTMKPVTGGNRPTLSQVAPPPGAQLGGPAMGRGRGGYRGPKPPPFNYSNQATRVFRQGDF